MSAVAFSCEEFGLAITIEIDQLEHVYLRKRLVNRVPGPLPFALLFQPIEAIAVSSPIDDVHFPVVVYVITDDRKPSLSQFPFAMPLPLILVRAKVPKPAVGSQEIHFPV